jgi:hypothetical protein
MNNVINMFENAKVADYGPADFDIDQAPLTYITESGIQKASKHVIYRTDTGEELGIHGSRYSDLYDLSYKRMIDNQRDCINKSGLDLGGLSEDIQVSHNGAKCFVKHTLPDVKLRTPDGDQAALTFLTVSSLDGTFPFISTTGANQWACMNGQVFTNGAATMYKSRHTKKLDVDHAAKIMYQAVDIFKDEVDKWFVWSEIGVHNMDAFFAFAKAANAKAVFAWRKEYPTSPISEMLLQPKIYSNTALMYMWDKYTTHYSKKMGTNQWAVYNTLTDWSTHAPAARESSQVNIASISYKRGETVRDTIISNFREAA